MQWKRLGTLFRAALIVAFLSAPVLAVTPPDALPETARGVATLADGGETITLAGTPDRFRLAGLLLPQSRDAAFARTPFAGVAREALRTLLEGRTLSIHGLPVGADRHGRRPAQI